MYTHRRRSSISFLQASWICAGAVLSVMFAIAAFSGFWPWTRNPYPSYILQADAWLHGRLDLGRDYEWLELAIYEGKYYVSFPPFPSYILLPFVAIMGQSAPDTLIAWYVTLVGVLTAFRMCRNLGLSPAICIFWTLFLYLGTGYLFVAQTSWVWFFAQTLAFTLSLLSLNCALENKGGWSLGFWACSVGCRPLDALYLPLLFLLLRHHERDRSIPSWIRRHLTWAIAPCLIALSYMLLNYFRFGNPLEFGHNYLPEFVRAPLGQFSLSYVADHLKMLVHLPSVDSSRGNLIFSHVETNAFFLICPLSVSFLIALTQGICRTIRHALKHDRNDRETNPHKDRRDHPTEDLLLLILIPLLLLAHVFLLCMHRTLGGFQFGNRYFVDLMPFLLLGILIFKQPDERQDLYHLPLMVFGACVNILGTVQTYALWG